MPDAKISALTSYTNPDPVNDVLPIVDNTNTTTKKISRNNLLGITSAPVGKDDTQTLTAKTLTAPTINGATLSGTLSGTYTIGGTPTFPASVVTLTGSQTLTNKILTSPTINGPTITNASITADALTGFSSANSGAIYGIAVSSAAFTTNNIMPNNSLSNTGVFGSAWAWTPWTPTYSSTGGTLTTVTGSGRYSQIGKTINFRLTITMTNIGTATGNLQFTLPVTNQTSSVNAYVGSGREIASTGKQLTINVITATIVSVNYYDNTAPLTNGLVLSLLGTYEAA